MTVRTLRELLDILACPVCAGALQTSDSSLVCVVCRHSYEVEAGVPVLVAGLELPEAAAEHGVLGRLLHAAAAEPRIYDFVQRAVGYRKVAQTIKAWLAETPCSTVLDVGAGTGAVANLLPPGSSYIWLDYDRKKLSGFKQDGGGTRQAVIGDAQSLPFRDKSVDLVTTVDVTHHLENAGLERVLAEAARVTRGRVLLVDALRTGTTGNRFLWKYDRGARPRPLGALHEAITRDFVIERIETLSVLHTYVFCLARPRASGEREMPGVSSGIAT